MFEGYQTEDVKITDPSTFLCVLGDVVLGPDGLPVEDHKYVFSPEVVQKKVNKSQHIMELSNNLSFKVDAKSNVAKLVNIPIQLLTPDQAKVQFSKVISALPCGASEMPCHLLTAAYLMLLASPVTDQVPDLTKVPLIAVVGGCSLGKTATNELLLNHFSDKVNIRQIYL